MTSLELCGFGKRVFYEAEKSIDGADGKKKQIDSNHTEEASVTTNSQWGRLRANKRSRGGGKLRKRRDNSISYRLLVGDPSQEQKVHVLFLHGRCVLCTPMEVRQAEA
jgi:hypothetical protein